MVWKREITSKCKIVSHSKVTQNGNTSVKYKYLSTVVEYVYLVCYSILL